MASQPNILFLMTDQMQGRVLDPDHPCITPNFDKLAARGVRIKHAYTPNSVCSPARASLMTGLLPHSHGVLEVTHVVDDDQCCLRTDRPHWAQRLQQAGYATGYFGKWHIERSNELAQFGWEVDGGGGSERYRAHARKMKDSAAAPSWSVSKFLQDAPEGYRKNRFYGVFDTPGNTRNVGMTTDLASQFLDDAMQGDKPWCCFASVTEPHDPFYALKEDYELYDVDALPVPPNWADTDLRAGKPNLYTKAAQVWSDFTDRERKEAAACYYASITEIDREYGRLIDQVEAAGQLDNTIVVLTSDHGEMLGAHGMYCKNFSGYEEVHHIPMIVSGPGLAAGAAPDARAGLHDLAPTLLELAGAEQIVAPDSRSFAPLLKDPAAQAQHYQSGYAENNGGRYRLTQRVIWDGPWKLVYNGFDFDELFNIDEDPYEMNNRIDDPAARDALKKLMLQAWKIIKATNDHPLLNSHYPILRVAPYGPDILDEA